MVAFKVMSRVIQAPAEVVWNILVDVPRIPELMPFVRSVESITPGPVGTGYRWRELRKTLWIALRNECEYTAFEPPHHLEIRQRTTDGKALLLARIDVRSGSGTIVYTVVHRKPFVHTVTSFAAKGTTRAWLENVAAAAERPR